MNKSGVVGPRGHCFHPSCLLAGKTSPHTSSSPCRPPSCTELQAVWVWCWRAPALVYSFPPHWHLVSLQWRKRKAKGSSNTYSQVDAWEATVIYRPLIPLLFAAYLKDPAVFVVASAWHGQRSRCLHWCRSGSVGLGGPAWRKELVHGPWQQASQR